MFNDYHDFCKFCINTPMLSKEREQELFKGYSENPNQADLDELVLAHFKLVMRAVNRLKNSYPTLDPLDIAMEGSTGLLIAIDKFDPERGNRFSTYAQWWVKRAISDYCQNYTPIQGPKGTDARKVFFSLSLVRREVSATCALPKEKIEELAQKLEVSPSAISAAAAFITASRMTPLDNIIKPGHENPYTPLDFLADPEPTPDLHTEIMDSARNEHAWLEEGLNKLNERERHIITCRRLSEKPVTLRELAEHYNLTIEAIRQAEQRAFNKLQEFMLDRASAEHRERGYDARFEIA